MPTPNDDSAPGRRRRLLIGLTIAAVVIVFVVLHVTGVMGPGSH